MSKRSPRHSRETRWTPDVEAEQNVEVAETPAESPRGETPFGEGSRGRQDSVLHFILRPLSSLRLTVALFAMAIFIVLAGTLGQVYQDIWDVVHDYFRLTSGGESELPALFAWIDLKIFFPPSFFPGGNLPDLSESIRPARVLTSLVLGFGWSALIWLVPSRERKFQAGLFLASGLTLSALTAHLNGFWFPKGWVIGFVMALNLVAAHVVRFKVQAAGSRLWAGLGIIGLGIAATTLVILSGSNKAGLQESPILDWSTVWVLFEFALVGVVTAGVYTVISMHAAALKRRKAGEPDPSAHRTMRRLLWGTNFLLGGLAVYLLTGGDRIGDSGMRILWQLLKATAAGLVLLTGCALVFRKRAGVVLLHAGVGLMMFSELLVGIAAVEGQMQIFEGESSSFVQDIRSVELAVVDAKSPEEDHVVVIPKRFLKEGRTIEDDKLPFDVRIDQVYRNSKLRDLKPGEKNPADSGAGLAFIAVPIEAGTGTDTDSKVDLSSIYATFYSKDGERHLGTWLLSQRLLTQDVEVDGKTYTVSLRFKRTHKPYTIHLKDVIKEDYLGTNTPKDYRSIIQLTDPTFNEDREVHIWMNNPLRYAGETFYQSGYDKDAETGQEVTVLQVVTNTGWMIPYVSCMIVAVGMLAHFMIALLRFLDRNSAEAAALRKSSPAEAEVDFIEPVETVALGKPKAKLKHLPARKAYQPDPLNRPSSIRWLTPVLSLCLVVVWGGYLGSKARISKVADGEFDYHQAGQIPIAEQGRVKPLDTLARNSLRILSNRQDYKDDDGNKQPAMRWLLDLITHTEKSDEYKVFRIDYSQLLDTLKLHERKGFCYSFNEIKGEMEELNKQAELARSVGNTSRTIYQTKVLELQRKLQLRSLLHHAFGRPEFQEKSALADLITSVLTNKSLASSPDPQPPLMASTATGQWEIYNSIAIRQAVQQLALRHKADNAEALAQQLVEDFAEPLAAIEIKDQWDRVKAHASQPNWKQTVSETAKLIATVEQDPNQRAVFEVIAQASPHDKPEELAAKLPKDVVQHLFQENAPYFVANIAKMLPPEVIQEVGRAARLQSPRPNSEEAIRFLTALGEKMIGEALDGQPLVSSHAAQAEAPFTKLLKAYEADNVEAFNELAANQETVYQDTLAEDSPISINYQKVRFEAFFNHAAPFYYLAVVYLFAGLLSACAWLTCSQPMNRATFWLLCFSLIIHTAALIGRIYISGRPPVTNLYSSAVFIGWACVLLGLLFEQFYRMGIGNLVAAVAGFLTLGIAHLLTTEVSSFKGDSFTVMQAVLDTQIWLATHVVCISIGYATTYVAGLFGICYVLGGTFSPLLTQQRRKDLARMIYGTICFAIFFSFVGTVLGGLWADDSWGRFWGWDPKENGALIIVLWNALVLHARWGGLVKDRGLAVLAVAGNVCVSWSWFGVNELGKGLHSYGFTEGVVTTLLLFVISQLLIMGIGSLPKAYWWSHIAEKSKAN